MKLILVEHNNKLYTQISIKEVKKVNFHLVRDKVPGSNSFPASFFQTFWEIIGQDLTKAVEESRKKATMLKYLNNTFISLIPKRYKIEMMDDFRPISLCKTTYKIMTKAIVNRLKEVSKVIILEEQIGFMYGRLIIKGIIVAHEAIHTIRRKKWRE